MSQTRDPFVDPQPGDVLKMADGKQWFVREREGDWIIFEARDGSGRYSECELPLSAWMAFCAALLEKLEVVNVAD